MKYQASPRELAGARKRYYRNRKKQLERESRLDRIEYKRVWHFKKLYGKNWLARLIHRDLMEVIRNETL